MGNTGFFAYPSIVSIAEVARETIKNINGSGIVQITSWEDLKTSGLTIIGSICEKIIDSDIFIADLTYLNPNVLFELGFAIAKNKKIVVFLDPSIEKSKNDYERFNLSTLGYLPYSNSYTMVDRFFAEAPFDDLEKTVLSEIDFQYTEKTNGILYLKSSIDTQASIKLSQKIEKSKIKPLVIDDPQEIRMQMHHWYIENSYKAFAVVGHLISDEHSGKELHNAKVAFAVGLGYGFNKKVIMLAHEPFICPLDYRHILKHHSTATECEKAIEPWLKEVELLYIEEQKKEVAFIEKRKAIDDIKSIDIGDYIAEQESEKIHDYFIETAAYGEALKSRYTIFIGRKGCGKSAILYELEYELAQDPRDHTCVIKPISYELNGLIAILKSIEGSAEKGFLIESLWKYLIYTEIAKSIYEIIKNKPIYYESTEYEQELLTLIDSNSEIFLNDFSIRLEYVLGRLQRISTDQKGASQRLRVSEILHDSLIAKLRDALFSYFQHKDKVVVLIDNLDKTWKHGDDIPYLAQFLLGLLSVANRIADDFRFKEKKHKATEFSIVIFLRTDIFTYIYREARERDKIKYFNISWEDPEILWQVVEKRFTFSTGIDNPEVIWKRYFPDTVNGIETKKYIIDNILPRPRDILYFIKYALSNSISRKHERILEKDILDAQERYSQHAIDSLIVENGISVEDFEKILYEFVGMKSKITKKEIISIIDRSNISNVDVEILINLLCERCFLGRQVSASEFRYQNNHLDKDKIVALSNKYNETISNIDICYEINKAYRKYLEIIDI